MLDKAMLGTSYASTDNELEANSRAAVTSSSLDVLIDSMGSGTVRAILPHCENPMAISAKTAARLAVALCFFAIAMAIAVVALAVALETSASYEASGTIVDRLLDLPFTLLFPLVGGLVAIKRPSNLVGWALLLTGFASLSETLLLDYAELALLARPTADLPAGAAAAAIGSGAWTFLMTGIFMLFLRFPNGQLPSRHWRFLSPLVLLGFTLLWVGVATNAALDPPSRTLKTRWRHATGSSLLSTIS